MVSIRICFIYRKMSFLYGFCGHHPLVKSQLNLVALFESIFELANSALSHVLVLFILVEKALLLLSLSFDCHSTASE